MEHEGKSLPCTTLYNYTQTLDGQVALNPGFDHHAFIRRFYACPRECTWRFFHRCRKFPRGRRCLNNFPNRAREFKGDETCEVWGFEPVFAISVLRVVLYNCMLLMVPSALSAYWASQESNDPQTSTVAWNVVLGAMAVFWAAAAPVLAGTGILFQ